MCPLAAVRRAAGRFFRKPGREKLYQEIFPAEVAAWRERNARFIDVREAAEFRSGHIPGTENMPLTTFPEGLEPDGRPIVLVCASGNRSGYAAAHLSSLGFTDVANLLGGTAAWARENRPLMRD